MLLRSYGVSKEPEMKLGPDEALDERNRVVRGQIESGFHGTRKNADSVLENGLPAGNGTNRRLDHHVLGMKDSAFRGIGPVPAYPNDDVLKTPVKFAGEGGIVLEIRGVYGWRTDLHAPKAIKRLRQAEAEIAILRRVPVEKIVRIADVVIDRRGQEKPSNWRLNPRCNVR